MSLSENKCTHCGKPMSYCPDLCRFKCMHPKCHAARSAIDAIRARAGERLPTDCFDKVPEQPKGELVQVNFGGDPYKINQQMADEIKAVVDSYQGRISLAAAIGVLEITKINLWSAHNGE